MEDSEDDAYCCEKMEGEGGNVDRDEKEEGRLRRECSGKGELEVGETL
jgi:hypothetical protein